MEKWGKERKGKEGKGEGKSGDRRRWKARCVQLFPTPSQTFLKTKSPFLSETREKKPWIFSVTPHKKIPGHLSALFPSELHGIPHQPAPGRTTGSKNPSGISRCPHKTTSHTAQRRRSTVLVGSLSFWFNHLFCTHLPVQTSHPRASQGMAAFSWDLAVSGSNGWVSTAPNSGDR